MMKLNRFALVAGALALGAAACGDDVQVVEPTPPQPPPPPPVTATMAPASASVAVGNSVVFAVNASGGVAGEAASWTCSSSNTGIATVTSTSAGCSATGVAAGDVTITASVTKSGETVNVGAQLTVTDDTEPTQPPGDPAFVYIQNIADGAATVSGRVAVGISVDRGDQTVEELSLLVDGAVVASQSFGGGMDMGMTPPEDEAAEQAVPTFTMAFDSDDYDRDTGVPVYANGEHTISAELEIAVDMADGTHGHETVSSNTVSVEFKNSNFVGVSIAGLGDGAMNSNTGQVWYGGPDVMPEITAVPVSYSGGGAVASLTLLSICGADAATDSEAPFVFTVECKKGQSKETLKFNVEGEEIDARGDEEVYLDFQAPTAPNFRANPGDVDADGMPIERQDGWINADVRFTSKWENKDGRRDGWLIYNDKDADNPASGGVGGYTAQIRFSTTSPSVVDGALEATPNALPTAPTEKDAACVVATAVDLLGNESKLPSAGSGCAKAADYTANADGDYPAGLRAGLDVVPPTIAFSGTSPTKNDRNLSSQFQLQVADPDPGSKVGQSGLPTAPVLARVEIRNAKNEVICGDDSATDMDLPGTENLRGVCENNAEGLTYDDVLDLVTTSGLPTTNPAYYTLTAVGRDKAGNLSEPISRVALHDDGNNAVSLIGGSYDPKKAVHNLIISVTDNFSIRDYYVALDFPGTLLPTGSDGSTNITRIRLMNPVAVDEYNSDELTKSVDAGGAYNAFVALQGTTATGNDPIVHDVASFVAVDASDARAVTVLARDQAHNSRKYTSLKSDAVDVVLSATEGFPVAVEARTLITPVSGDATDTRAESFGLGSFTFDTDESMYDVDDTIELTAEVIGYSRDAKDYVVNGDEDDRETGSTETDDFGAVTAVPFLNPFKRVDFYAVSRGPDTADDEVSDDELRFIASVGATGAGAKPGDPDEDTTDTDRATADNEVTFTYGVEVSAADFYAAVQDSGKGDYTGGVIAIGVSVEDDDLPTSGGVGLVSQAMSITIDK